MGIFDLFKGKETKIREEKIEFNSMSERDKEYYILRNPKTLIRDYIENYLKEKKKKKEKKEKKEIVLLKNLIKIETKLKKKFDDKFYSGISLINFNEKLNLILNSINEKNDIETYRKEKVLEDKIKFFTFFQIFNDDLYNIDLNPVKNGTIYDQHRISFNNKFSINENFILKLNEILKNKETPFIPKSNLRLNKSGDSIYLKTLIENHLISNYEKIVGNIQKIENLNQLYKKYKDLSSRVIPFSELGIRNRLGKWKYKFYEKKHVPEIKMIPNDNKNYTIEGEKVLNEIKLILESYKSLRVMKKTIESEYGTLSQSESGYVLELPDLSNIDYDSLKNLISNDMKVTIDFRVSLEGDIVTEDENEHYGVTYTQTQIIKLHEEKHWNHEWFLGFDDVNMCNPNGFLNQVGSSLDFDDYEGERIVEEDSHEPEDITNFSMIIEGNLDVESVEKILNFDFFKKKIKHLKTNENICFVSREDLEFKNLSVFASMTGEFLKWVVMDLSTRKVVFTSDSADECDKWIGNEVDFNKKDNQPSLNQFTKKEQNDLRVYAFLRCMTEIMNANGDTHPNEVAFFEKHTQDERVKLLKPYDESSEEFKFVWGPQDLNNIYLNNILINRKNLISVIRTHKTLDLGVFLETLIAMAQSERNMVEKQFDYLQGLYADIHDLSKEESFKMFESHLRKLGIIA